MSLGARRSVLGSLRVKHRHKQAAGVCCASTAWLWYAGGLAPSALPGSPRFSGPQPRLVRSYKKFQFKKHRQFTSELVAMDELSISDAQPPPEPTSARPAPSTSAAQAIDFLMLTQNLKASGSCGSPCCLARHWGGTPGLHQRCYDKAVTCRADDKAHGLGTQRGGRAGEHRRPHVSHELDGAPCRRRWRGHQQVLHSYLSGHPGL